MQLCRADKGEVDIVVYMSFIVSIISIILSLFNFIYLLYTNRFNINVKFDYFFVEPQIRKWCPLTYKVTIENKSRQPIAITGLKLKVGNTLYNFSDSSRLLLDTSSMDEFLSDRLSVTPLPQEIKGLGALKGYFQVFDTNPFIKSENKHITWDNGKICMETISRKRRISHYLYKS